MIYSTLYYAGSLTDPQTLVRDNRFYPCKAIEGFAVWWQYLRRNYPDQDVVLFYDDKSPIPVESYIDTIGERWVDVDWPQGKPHEQIDVSTGSESYVDYLRKHTKEALQPPPRIHLKRLSEHSGKYFWAMQRNLVEGITLAYLLDDDLFWLDNDAFLNTNIYPLIEAADAEVAAPQIAHHQMTMDSVCTYISHSRLHALDGVVNLPKYLKGVLTNGPTDLRMHSLQEGGLYKTFAYGRTLELGGSIELSHLSCYDHFLSFLKRNPLDTPEWRRLVELLEGVDWSRMPGVERTFHDMDYKVTHE